MKKAHSKETLKLRTETIRHLKELAERDLRQVNGGEDDTRTGYWWCTSTVNG